MSPRPFPHILDPAEHSIIYVSADPRRVQSTMFLDGREVFWAGPAQHRPLKLSASNSATTLDTDIRLIFHMSFCGSTLLSNLIASQSQQLVLREPNILVDFANWHSAWRNNKQFVTPPPSIEEMFGRLLAYCPNEFESVVVKPSNWANTLLPLITESALAVRAVFITISQREFLKTVFHGGRSRMEFIARLCEHLAPNIHDGEKLLALATNASSNPYTTVARLTLLAHKMQEALFNQAMDWTGWVDREVVAFSDIVNDPVKILNVAAKTLNVQLRSRNDGIVGVLSKNSKQPESEFSKNVREQELEVVEDLYGIHFDDASTWMTSITGDSDLVCNSY